MAGRLRAILSSKELRKKVGYVLLLLVLFRIVAHITLPGVNTDRLQQLFDSNQLFGLLNLFSGGALDNFSMVALGVGPYITAAIMMQMLVYVIPSLERLQKEEGEAGRQKVSQITRWLSLPLALVQSYALIVFLQRSGQGILEPGFGVFETVSMMLAMTAGSVFLMWLGELITERGIGNGVSILIFASIVAALPGALQQTVGAYDGSKLVELLTFAAIAIGTVAAIVFITEGQRNILVSYARQQQGGGSAFLPLRVNQAGVIPIIFAISLMIFPPILGNFFIDAEGWSGDFARNVVAWFGDTSHPLYIAIYGLLVVVFTYFYVGVTFDPKQISENLQRRGGFISGVRPGTETQAYLKYVSSRITLTGAVFLGLVAILPNVVSAFVSIPALQIGGTGILIVVSVVIETMRQIDAQLVMRDYDSFYTS